MHDNLDMVIEHKYVKFYAINQALYLLIKRFLDITISIIGFLILIPAILFVKISYMLNGDFHRIIFTQSRIGKDGKEFKFYKFRTMVDNADEVLKEMLRKDKKLAKEYKINKKLKDDPRITKVGKFLRKTSIDELPQLINVLKGDMSLIGNRPYLPREKKDMGNYFDDIVSTKPGLTGYWQVSGRSDTTFDYRLKCERFYSLNRNFKMDVKIFIKTFATVLGHKGAR